MKTILKVENLEVYFRKKKKIIKALQGVDLQLEEGITAALAGESGCGKTTLARTILGFYKPRRGKIYFKDKDITLPSHEKIIRENIQIVFQNPHLSLDPRYKVFSSLYEALQVRRRYNLKESQEIIEKALKEVKLSAEIMHRYPHQLSGGQKQRVCIARSILNEPSLVILDEPTSALDITTESKIISLLKELRENKKITFLFISHNLKLLKRVAFSSYIMYEGKIVEYSKNNLIYKNPLHPYTKLLLQAAEYKLTDFSLETYKTLKEKDNGRQSLFCSFYPFCPVKAKICQQEPLFMREVEKGHFLLCHRPDNKGVGS